MNKQILLINPSIHDFSAFNLWARPLGLLRVASFLKNVGFEIDLIDCLSLEYEKDFIKDNPTSKQSKQKKFSTYQYFKQEINKPSVYSTIKRHYYRFGINPIYLKKLLLNKKKPAIVLVTSIMTYWYSGVFEVIKTVKEIYPDIPVILGGIYAKLCTEHAKNFSRADFIFTSNKLDDLLIILQKYLKFSSSMISSQFKHLNYFHPYPAFDFYEKNDFIPFELSNGCPFNCKYCASRYLTQFYKERNPDDFIKEIKFWQEKFDIKNIAFYDDALLVNKKSKFIPILKKIIQNNFNINFHTPNGLHIRYIDNEVIRLMKDARVKTIRLSFESNSPRIQNDSSNKTNCDDFLRSVEQLYKHGYSRENIGVYILVGLPKQSLEEVYSAIEFVKKTGLKPKLSEYSPLPHTQYFNIIDNNINNKILAEPLLQNNSTLQLWSKNFDENTIENLKQYSRE